MLLICGWAWDMTCEECMGMHARSPGVGETACASESPRADCMTAVFGEMLPVQGHTLCAGAACAI